MAFCGPFRTVPLICLKIRPLQPRFYQTLLDYATHTNSFSTFCRPKQSYFCLFRNDAKCLTQKLMPYDGNLNALSLQRCISTRSLMKSQRSLFNFRPNLTNYVRFHSTSNKHSNRSTLYYFTAFAVVTLGLSYAAVPLYRIFCQAYSYGGAIKQVDNSEKIASMKKIEDRVLTIRFNADTASSMQWNFRPEQHEIKVPVGETALAFYTARNPSDRPVIGVSTYNVLPFEAGQYFNKIQCFCFEEQQLNPHEEVHMPVFFYIDPEFDDDPNMDEVEELTLSYTFFEAREGLKIPLPNFARK